jgi:peptidyl-prolyl cis-trans isomerase SurA
MSELRQVRLLIAGAIRQWTCLAIMLAGLTAHAQTAEKSSASGQSIMLDSVVAIVNRQTILASDLEDEMQISILDPSRNLQAKETAKQALDRLISRTLIQQEIRQEDVAALQPSQADINSRVQELRKDLPACIRANCASDAGWNAFLVTHDLTPAGVENYIRSRMEILSFIEERFRQGIRITPEEIETYYSGTLLPQYPAGITPPPLPQVSSRIEEILLQQRVNDLFSSWLANLRKQGQIEILDPALATTADSDNEGATRE